jgi:CubicO group peptidase (beta-lactamase class C family)
MPRSLSRRDVLEVAVFGALAWSPLCRADAVAPDLSGTWTGRISAGARTFTMRFDVTLGPTVRLTTLEDGETRTADEATVRDGRVLLVFKGAFARFEGRFVGPDRIEGEWKQTVYRLPLVLTRGAEVAAGSVAAPVALTDARLRELRENSGAPALAAAWAHLDRPARILAVGRRAADNPTEVTVQDRWHVGSLTKSMTATLIATAVEAGELAWSDTVEQRLPALTGSLDAPTRAITLLELLSHRSGLPANLPDTELESFARASTSMLDERRRFAALALALPKVGPPRATFEYSNTGYVVAAAMLEARTGRPWEVLLAERVFAPLGISSAGYGPPAERSGNPVGHRESRLPRWLRSTRIPVRPAGNEIADNVAAMGPAGRVHLAPDDMLRYLAAHRDQRVLLRPETWQNLHTPPFGGDYALGWVRRGDGSLWHNGSNTLWYAEALVTSDAVAAAFCNDGTLDRVMPAVSAALLSALAAAQG